jgi:superfamily II DNA helicase RecQ
MLTMPIKFFAVPALDPGDAEGEVNRFCRGRRVITIDRQLVTVNERPVWCLAVEFVESSVSPGQVGTGGSDFARPRIDYKQVLNSSDFGVFSRLRLLRKEIAEQEGVPVFAIFSNEQLATIAQKRPTNAAELQAIDGVGSGKSGKYGDRLLDLLRTFHPAALTPSDPTPLPEPNVAIAP